MRVGTATVDVRVNLSQLEAGLRRIETLASRSARTVENTLSNISAGTTDYGRATAGASKDVDKLTHSIERHKRGMRGLLPHVAQVTVAYMAARAAWRSLITGITVGAEFEHKMAFVKAVTQDLAVGFKDLTEQFNAQKEAAKKAGETTKWTAQEAAEALKYLSMAGFDAKEGIEALPGVLQLALVGELELGRATDIVTDTLRAMGLQAKDLTRVNDVFVATITRTNTDIEKMGQAMKFAAPVAGALGYQIEEVAAMIGLLSQSGVKAGIAGRNIQQAMVRSSQAAAAFGSKSSHLMDVLSALNERQKEYEKTLGKVRAREMILTEARKAFGLISLKSVLVLKENIEGYKKLEEANVKATGEMKKAADIIEGTTINMFKKLAAAVSSISIDIWEKYQDRIKMAIFNATYYILEHKDEVIKFFDDMVRAAKNIATFALPTIYFIGDAIKAVYNVVKLFPEEVTGAGGMGLIAFLFTRNVPLSALITLSSMLIKLADDAKTAQDALSETGSTQILGESDEYGASIKTLETQNAVYQAAIDSLDKQIKRYESKKAEADKAKATIEEYKEKGIYEESKYILGPTEKLAAKVDDINDKLTELENRRKKIAGELTNIKEAETKVAPKDSTKKIEESTEDMAKALEERAAKVEDAMKKYKEKLKSIWVGDNSELDKELIELYEKDYGDILALDDRLAEAVDKSRFTESIKTQLEFIKKTRSASAGEYEALVSRLTKTRGEVTSIIEKAADKEVTLESSKWQVMRNDLNLYMNILKHMYLENDEILIKEKKRVEKAMTAIQKLEDADRTKALKKELEEQRRLRKRELSALKSIYKDMSNLRVDDTDIALEMLKMEYEQHVINGVDKHLADLWYANEQQKIFDKQTVEHGKMIDAMNVGVRRWAENVENYSQMAASFMEDFLNGTQSDFSDAFAKMYDGQMDGWKEFLDNMSNRFKKFLSDLVAYAAMQKIFIPIVNQVIGGEFGQKILGGSLSDSLSSILKGVSPTSPGIDFGGLVGATSKGNVWMTSTNEEIQSGIDAQWAAAHPYANANLSELTAARPDLFGSGVTGVSPSAFESVMGKVGGFFKDFGGIGILAGLPKLLSGDILGAGTTGLGAMGGTALGTMAGSALSGTAIGSTLGSIIPGVGTIIGGFLGSLAGDWLGDVFGGGPPTIRGGFGLHMFEGQGGADQTKFDILNNPTISGWSSFNYEDKWQTEMQDKVSGLIEDTFNPVFGKISDTLNSLIGEGIITEDDIPDDFLSFDMHDFEVQGLKHTNEEFQAFLKSTIENWANDISKETEKLFGDISVKIVQRGLEKVDLDWLVDNHPLIQLADKLKEGLEAYGGDYDKYLADAQEFFNTTNTIMGAIGEILSQARDLGSEPLGDIESQLANMNNQFNDFSLTLQSLGASVKIVTEVENERAKALARIAKAPFMELGGKLEGRKLDQAFAGFGTEDWKYWFNNIQNEFNSLDTSSSDYYDKAIKLLNDQYEVASAIEGLNKDQLQQMYDFSDLLESFTMGALAPVESFEAYQRKYEDLVTAAAGGDNASAEELKSYVPQYLEFMRDYGGDYQALIDSVTQDLKDLQDISAENAGTGTNPADELFDIISQNVNSVNDLIDAQYNVIENFDEISKGLDWNKLYEDFKAQLGEGGVLDFRQYITAVNLNDYVTPVGEAETLATETATGTEGLGTTTGTEGLTPGTGNAGVEDMYVLSQDEIDAIARNVMPPEGLRPFQHGGMLTNPGAYFGGERGPSWPEYVVPTNPSDSSRFLSSIGINTGMIAREISSNINQGGGGNGLIELRIYTNDEFTEQKFISLMNSPEVIEVGRQKFNRK